MIIRYQDWCTRVLQFRPDLALAHFRRPEALDELIKSLEGGQGHHRGTTRDTVLK